MSIDYSDMAFPKPMKKSKDSVKTKWRRQKAPQKEKSKIVKKTRRKPRKYKKVKSIMQDKSDRRCYLCMLLEDDHRIHTYVEEHHVLYGSRKWISDAYGLRVNLCRRHHRQDKDALHDNSEYSLLLKQKAQQAFLETYPNEDWMEIVGKNYLEVENETTEEINSGI